MSAIQNANALQFICTMLRDGEPIDMTGASVTLRLQPRFNVLPELKPPARTGIAGEVLEALEGKVTATYDEIDLGGMWKAQFRVVMPVLSGGEVIYSEPHEFEVELNTGDA